MFVFQSRVVFPMLVVLLIGALTGIGLGSKVIAKDALDGFVMIYNIDELQAISDDPAGNYALAGNIDARVTEVWNDGAGFKPISGPFTGVFDGRGYVIDGLFIDRPEETNIGLFAQNGGTVRQVGLENVQIKGHDEVGALIGNNAGVVLDSYSTGRVENVLRGVGGLVGRNTGTGIIQHSFSSADVYGALRWVGGLVGYNDRGTIERSYSTGNVNNGSDGFIGGFVGANLGLITNSFATGNVTSEGPRVGGFIGTNQTARGVVENSYSTGKVSSLTDDRVGGFIGDHKTESRVQSSFWNKDTSGQDESGAGIGLSANEMQSKAFWEQTGWDIDVSGGQDHTWYLYSDDATPLLNPCEDCKTRVRVLEQD